MGQKFSRRKLPEKRQMVLHECPRPDCEATIHNPYGVIAIRGTNVYLCGCGDCKGRRLVHQSKLSTRKVVGEIEAAVTEKEAYPSPEYPL